KTLQSLQQGMAMRADPEQLTGFFGSLPFELTGAQKRVVDEILRDVSGTVPMTRLLQGDVGSGKTVVAAAALVVATSNGAQGVLMAPTEILAEQHFKSLSKMLGGIGVRDQGSGVGDKAAKSKIQNPKSKIKGPRPLTIRLL